MPDTTKACPDCAEQILVAARICKHCGWGKKRAAPSARQPSTLRIVMIVVAVIVFGPLALKILGALWLQTDAAKNAERARKRQEIEDADAAYRHEQKMREILGSSDYEKIKSDAERRR